MITKDINEPDSLFGLPLYPKKDLRESHGGSLNHILVKSNDQFDSRQASKRLRVESEQSWIRRGEERARHLFHAVAENVPAYRDFLKQKNIDSQSIKNNEDFKRVPLTDKESYLRKYPIDQLVWHGDISNSSTIVASSGTSGEPFFWPKNTITDMQTDFEHELALLDQFDLHTRSTLVIVCFAMGMHVAGTTTVKGFNHLARKGYPLSVISPGYVTENILSIVKHLSTKYDQMILAGYPPYLKEIIDRGNDQNINWRITPLRFLLAGEGFNESWRSYIGDLTGSKPDQDFISLYGSADASMMAFETKHSVNVRRIITGLDAISQRIFDDDRVPSLFQYYPENNWFEMVDKNLVLTSTGCIPLVRYNTQDEGGIMTNEELRQSINIKSDQPWNLPFVYVFGRSTHTIVLYGANIYLEHIRVALENKSLNQHLTGKIIMYTDLDSQRNVRFKLDVEHVSTTKPHPELNANIELAVHDTLLKMNSEYSVIHNSIGNRVEPIVKILPRGHSIFYSKNIKMKWIKDKS